MTIDDTGSPLNALADAATRGIAAEKLALAWGVEAVLVLIRDPELGILRPAPGFLPTLPGGPSWRALLKSELYASGWVGTVAYPRRDRMVDCTAQRDAAGHAVLVLIGGKALGIVLDLDKLGFPLLAALLRAECDVVNASGLVRTAANALDRAETLTSSLDAVRSHLTKALADSDVSNRALAELNATLEDRVQERTRQLETEMAERAKAEEGLRQSQKMEAVGQLTGGLAHDFNNLLAGISGSLELMALRIAQGRIAELDRYMVAAQGASRRAAALTHRLLAFSRRQTLEPRATDVNTLVASMEDLVRRTVGPSIVIEVVGATSLWPALVDPPQLENALLNLCINARDAMPDGGRITIETHNKYLDDHAAQPHDMPSGQYLALCVTDTGTGMSPDLVKKVFEPFFTTKPIGEGTGLGLSMIYGFARQSGGQVRIYSEVGVGTTVCIYLPRHYGEAAVEEIEGRNQQVANRAGEGETVLVVDDEPSVRMLITDVLADLGYVALEAADSATGLKILQSDARIDLLVTDVGLPGGLNGRQMADAGRLKRPKLKVLFITGYAENAVLGNGHLAPDMRILTKPFVLDTLIAKVRELVIAREPDS